MLILRDSEIVSEGIVRTKVRGIERLYTFVKDALEIQDLSIAYSTDYDSAVALRQRLASVFPEQKVYAEQIGSALGVHCGPDAVFVAFKRAK